MNQQKKNQPTMEKLAETMECEGGKSRLREV